MRALDTSVVPIERLEDNLYRVEGTLPGMPLRRVMVVVRLSDGRLLIHSAIALEPSALAELEALGTPSVLVVPSRYHRMDAPFYAQRYLGMTVLCPRGAREHVAQVVRVDGDCDSLSDPNVSFEHVAGTRDAEAVMIVRSGAAVSLVVNDIVFNMPHAPGFSGFVVKHVFASSGGPRVSRIGRLFLIKDRAAVRAQLERLAELPGLRRVIVAHHEVIDDDPKAALRAVAASL